MDPMTIGLLATAAVGAAKAIFGKKPGEAPAPSGNSYADLQAMQAANKPNPLAAAGTQIGQQTAQPFQPLPVAQQAPIAPAPVVIGTQPVQDPLERLRQLQGPGF
jgi:hypothetical protein